MAHFTGDFNGTFGSGGCGSSCLCRFVSVNEIQNKKADAEDGGPELWPRQLFYFFRGFSGPPLLTEVGIVVIAGFVAQTPICNFIAFGAGLPGRAPKGRLQRFFVAFVVFFSGILTSVIWAILVSWPRVVAPYCRPWLP